MVDWSLLYGDDKKEFKARFRQNPDASGMKKVMRLLKKQKKSLSSFGKFSGRKMSFSPTAKNQRVVVKCRFGKSLAGHKKYLNVYMVQKDKDEVDEKPRLFGDDVEEYKKNMVANCLKFIVSPENDKVPLELLCHQLMERCKLETGLDFYWVGAIHKNTGQKHAHILVNGVDRFGREVRFPRNLVRNKMREISCEYATGFVGERTKEEIEIAKSRSVESLRYTKLDDEIAMFEEMTRNDILPFNVESQKRLRFLHQQGLADFDCNTGRYSLVDDWKETLCIQGRYNTFLQEKKNAKAKNCRLEFFGKGSNANFVSGKVEKIITMDDENVWNNALIVRSEEKMFYVPIFKKIQGLKCGERIVCEMDGENVNVHFADKEKGKSQQSGRYQ